MTSTPQKYTTESEKDTHYQLVLQTILAMPKRWSFEDKATSLNKEGVFTSFGKEWSRQSLHRFLKNWSEKLAVTS